MRHRLPPCSPADQGKRDADQTTGDGRGNRDRGAVRCGAGVLVPPGSTIQTLADLRGKRIGCPGASSAHNLTIAALEKAGIAWGGITPVELAPADARAAFARGDLAAWRIWDPLFAVAEGAPGISLQYSFFPANRDFVAKYPDTVALVNRELADLALWAGEHRPERAALLAETTRVAPAASQRAVDRTDYRISPVAPHLVQSPRRIADRFQRLGLIPACIEVQDWVIVPGALPYLFVGARCALGIKWLTLIVAETITANSGLGQPRRSVRGAGPGRGDGRRLGRHLCRLRPCRAHQCRQWLWPLAAGDGPAAPDAGLSGRLWCNPRRRTSRERRAALTDRPNPMVYYCDCAPPWVPAREGEGNGARAVAGSVLGLGLVRLGLRA